MSAPTGSDLLAFMGGASAGPADASTADSLVLGAAKYCEQQTGLVFDYGSHVRYEDGGEGRRRYDRSGFAYSEGSRRFFLSMQDWTVTEVATRGFGGEWVAMASTEWEQLGRRVRRANGYAFPAGEDNVRITWTGGYDAEHPMPDDLRQAILDLAATWMRNRKTMTPTHTEFGAIRLPDRVPLTTRAILDNYVMPHGL